MELSNRIRSDVTQAMKRGDRERVSALRLVLSELQKDAKEGGSDELAVLRRERKRRLDAASAFADGGRAELAERERGEATLIEEYLPAELPDSELDAIVAEAAASAGASSTADMGRVMGAAMAAVDGRADGRRVSERVRAHLARG